MSSSSREETSADVVFVYTGGGCRVPKDVISVRCNEGLQKIGFRAFYDCTSLRSIILSSTVTEICYAAFNSCSNLREVTLNNGLQKIGMLTFYEVH